MSQTTVPEPAPTHPDALGSGPTLSYQALRRALEEASGLLAVGSAGARECADGKNYGAAYCHLEECVRQAREALNKALTS